MNEKIKCPKCGSDKTFFNVNLFITAPSNYFHRLSKKALRNKAIRLEGASWDKVTIWCANCGYYSNNL